MNPCFLRPFNDWELELVNGFIYTIQNKRIRPHVKDRMVWKKTKDDLFSVKSIFDELEGGRECSPVSKKDDMESLCSHKGGFLCMGSVVGVKE